MSMKVTRFDAALTYALAGLGLWISYTALADLAARAGLGPTQAAVWPLVVDGLILAATRAVVTFGAHDARRYAWALLWCAAAVSIAGNVAHALLPSGPVHPTVAAAVAVVPPVAALAMTHLAVVRARVRRDMEVAVAVAASPQVEAAPQPDAPLSDAAEMADSNAPEPDHVAPLVSVDAPNDAPVVPNDAPNDAPVVPNDAPTGAPVTQPAVDARQLVLDLLDAGELTGRAIAQKAGVSETTVRRYKLAARDATAA